MGDERFEVERRHLDNCASRFKALFPGDISPFPVTLVEIIGDNLILTFPEGYVRQRCIQVRPPKAVLKRIQQACVRFTGTECTLVICNSGNLASLNIHWSKTERPVEAEEFGDVIDEGPFSILAMRFRMQKIG